MSWNPYANPIDHIVLAGQRSPGVADVEGAKRSREWDQKKGANNSGATLRFKGDALVAFTVKLRFYTPEHFTAWDSWKELITKPAIEASKIRALDIEHPMLADLGIRSVVVKDFTQPEQTADGEFTVTIEFLEYKPPVKVVARAAGSNASSTAFDPNAAERAELTLLNAQVAAQDVRAQRIQARQQQRADAEAGS